MVPFTCHILHGPMQEEITLILVAYPFYRHAIKKALTHNPSPTRLRRNVLILQLEKDFGLDNILLW